MVIAIRTEHFSEIDLKIKVRQNDISSLHIRPWLHLHFWNAAFFFVFSNVIYIWNSKTHVAFQNAVFIVLSHKKYILRARKRCVSHFWFHQQLIFLLKDWWTPSLTFAMTSDSIGSSSTVGQTTKNCAAPGSNTFSRYVTIYLI